jgi:putative restriction endonuclease
VFCGFGPSALPERSGLLYASHIKPWARSTASERIDIRNGLAACPIHDAAFDRGYITVLPDHRIIISTLLEESIRNEDPRVDVYFRDVLRHHIESPSDTLHPRQSYLKYHRENIFRR